MSSEKLKSVYFSEEDWEKKLQELQLKYENSKNKKRFKPFIDSIGELVDRKLVIKDEAKEAFRIGKAGERFKARMTKLAAPERLYKLEVEEALLEALVGIIQVYDALPSTFVSDEEKDFIKYLKDRKLKMTWNLYHKRDRLERPEVYTDINKRYDTQKRER